MAHSAKLAVLTPELEALQRRWVTLRRPDQDALYARELGPHFAPLFAELPLHGAPPGLDKPEALVSVLGLSWQPVALMAAWARPERMLIIGTRGSLNMRVEGEDVLSLISRLSRVHRDKIRVVEVGDPGEREIYRAVRDFSRQAGLSPENVFVDPTGGKKSMSSSAALAGFVAGAKLVYVDHAEYHERIPLAGSEYPRLLENPLTELGELELQYIFAAFDRSDFVEAQHLAEKLARRLYEPREAECLKLLAQGYAAWDRFDFPIASAELGEALCQLERFSAYGRWPWADAIVPRLEDNLRALQALARTRPRPSTIEEGTPLLVYYLAAARRLLAAGKQSLAVLLAYAAVERCANLCLWIHFGLADEQPDYETLHAVLDLERYHEVGRLFFGRRKYQRRELGGKLMFGNGVQLLVTLSDGPIRVDDLGALQGLASIRNKCEFEHGLVPQVPPRGEVEKALSKASEIIARLCGVEQVFEDELARCRFPMFGAR